MMLKNIIISSLAAFTLLMSGCGDSEGESKLKTQQMLDNGDFQGVINKLESSANSNSDYILLASAYMGKSGLTLTNLISTIADSSGDSSSSSGFAGFATALSSSTSSTAITDLRAAIDYYKKVVNDTCVNNANITSSQRNICLYIGLASTGSAAATIELLTGSIASFGTGLRDPKLTASVCAMQYASGTTVSTDCNVSSFGADVTFTQSQKIYTPFTITVASVPFEYLKSDTNKSVLTQDYCSLTDFATRQATKDAGYFVCPVNETTGPDLTTASVLVDVLNNGLDATASAANSDVQGDLDQFKCEILGGTYNGNTCTVSTSTDITESDITIYLSAQN